ncbi:MAG: ester cyclase [Candidatus Binatia bacterium]
MNLAWAKEWFAGFGGDVDKLMEKYADDVQFEDVIFAHKENGKAGLRNFFAAFGGPEAGEHVFAVTGYSGNAEGGAVEWNWQGKHAGNFLGVPAKGKETNIKGVSVLTFKNGKIASQHDYWDANAALRQLGAVK